MPGNFDSRAKISLLIAANSLSGAATKWNALGSVAVRVMSSLISTPPERCNNFFK